MSQIRTNSIVNETNDGSPDFPFGLPSGGSSDYAKVAGIATVAGYATNAGIATVAGISTVAEGLTGTPDIVVNTVTANEYGGYLFLDASLF